MPRLLNELAVGRGDGSYARLLTKLDLLAIDDGTVPWEGRCLCDGDLVGLGLDGDGIAVANGTL